MNLRWEGGRCRLTSRRSEIRLVTRALRECWPIPEEARSRAITQVQNIIENCDHRLGISHCGDPSDHVRQQAQPGGPPGGHTAAEHHEDFTGRLEKIEQRMNVEGESQGGADGSFA